MFRAGLNAVSRSLGHAILAAVLVPVIGCAASQSRTEDPTLPGSGQTEEGSAARLTAGDLARVVLPASGWRISDSYSVGLDEEFDSSRSQTDCGNANAAKRAQNLGFVGGHTLAYGRVVPPKEARVSTVQLYQSDERAKEAFSAIKKRLAEGCADSVFMGDFDPAVEGNTAGIKLQETDPAKDEFRFRTVLLMQRGPVVAQVEIQDDAGSAATDTLTSAARELLRRIESAAGQSANASPILADTGSVDSARFEAALSRFKQDLQTVELLPNGLRSVSTSSGFKRQANGCERWLADTGLLGTPEQVVDGSVVIQVYLSVRAYADEATANRCASGDTQAVRPVSECNKAMLTLLERIQGHAGELPPLPVFDGGDVTPGCTVTVPTFATGDYSLEYEFAIAANVETGGNPHLLLRSYITRLPVGSFVLFVQTDVGGNDDTFLHSGVLAVVEASMQRALPGLRASVYEE